MALLRNRTNLITVRLSEDEHRRLKRACEDGEARSISDFVREIIVQRIAALHELSDRILNILGPVEPREDQKCKILS
jgi:Arc/MetJ-type ribon-helix-helix transcriptional regulator